LHGSDNSKYLIRSMTCRLVCFDRKYNATRHRFVILNICLSTFFPYEFFVVVVTRKKSQEKRETADDHRLRLWLMSNCKCNSRFFFFFFFYISNVKTIRLYVRQTNLPLFFHHFFNLKKIEENAQRNIVKTLGVFFSSGTRSNKAMVTFFLRCGPSGLIFFFIFLSFLVF
jgi:hypothetical protein